MSSGEEHDSDDGQVAHRSGQYGSDDGVGKRGYADVKTPEKQR